MKNIDDNKTEDLIKRIARLEDAVFGTKEAELKSQPKKYVGAKGGVLMLINHGFLDEKHSAAQVSAELEKNGFHYRREVVQTALKRLSNVSEPLTAFTEEGIKVYVRRK